MNDKIDLNLANEETLQHLEGIGPALAKRIITYREDVHPFEEVIELTAVPGISEKMVRAFADQLTVTPPATAVVPDAPETAPPVLEPPEESPPPFVEEITPPVSEPETVPDTTAAPAEAVPESSLAEEENEETAGETAANEDEPADESDAPAAEPAAEQQAEPDSPAEEEPAAAASDGPASLYTPVSTIFPETELAATDITAEPEAETAADTETEPSVEQPFSSEETTTTPAFDLTAWDNQARRRGCLVTLLGSTLGAVLGVALTLIILSSLNNGTLTYTAADAAIINELDSEVISRTTQMNNLDNRLTNLATREAAAQSDFIVQQGELAATINALEAEITDLEDGISDLEEEAAALDSRITSVAGAADTFTQFLEGLNQLLDEALPPAPAGAADAEPVAVTPETPTVTPTAVDDSPATRTPQPTATPLFATSTPAPQP